MKYGKIKPNFKKTLKAFMLTTVRNTFLDKYVLENSCIFEIFVLGKNKNILEISGFGKNKKVLNCFYK